MTARPRPPENRRAGQEPAAWYAEAETHRRIAGRKLDPGGERQYSETDLRILVDTTAYDTGSQRAWFEGEHPCEPF